MTDPTQSLEAGDRKEMTNVRGQLIAFLRQQVNLKYIMIYENDFDFADKLLKAITPPENQSGK